MKLFRKKNELQSKIKNIKSIGFVPTMGALHKGHISLIKRSTRETKNTVVSIFVNPKQFENRKDFKHYPKNTKNDLKILKKLGVKYLYCPSYSDIFKFNSKLSTFKHNFSKKLCGKFRKGHFEGVLNVVNRFLEIIKPKRIYLGDKDFQQLVLINEHIKKRKIRTKVINCKTIRDNNFIAYSSRLQKIKNVEKRKLIKVIKFLRNYKKNIKFNNTKHNFSYLKKKLLSYGVNKIDYIELINKNTLNYPKKNKFNLFFAFYIGKIRYIDNF